MVLIIQSQNASTRLLVGGEHIEVQYGVWDGVKSPALSRGDELEDL